MDLLELWKLFKELILTVVAYHDYDLNPISLTLVPRPIELSHYPVWRRLSYICSWPNFYPAQYVCAYPEVSITEFGMW